MQVTKEMISILGDELYKLLPAGITRNDPRWAKASAIMLTRLFSKMWQPIETAPRDGTTILLFDPKRGQRMGWTFENDPWQVSPPSAWNATHWMPLPPTPETT